jgi:hypothetical protein
MKLGVPILAVLALMALGRSPAAGEPGRPFFVETEKPPIWFLWRQYGRRHYRSHMWYPYACESVIFPRSPLCAGRPIDAGPLPWGFWFY